MRYCVTGATGCLGLNLIKRLTAEGHEVIGLGRNEQLGSFITQMGAQFIAVDLQDLTQLKKAVRGSAVLFHCAALSSPWGKYKDFFQSNVQGTQHVIEATPEHSRLIHVSSPSIYFNFSEQHNIKEDAPLPSRPANHYVRSKLMAEALIDKAFKERNLNVVTLRPRAIFGAYDRAILPRLLAAEKKGILPIIGSGKNIIDITHVDNVVESLLLAAKASDSACGQKYNITNDDPKALIEILILLYAALNKPLRVKQLPYLLAKRLSSLLELIHRLPYLGEPRLTRYSCGVLALGQTLNIDAAKKTLHYKPIMSIEQGMLQFAEWYQSL